MNVIAVELTDCAEAHDAAALIAPLGIDTEFQRFQSFEAPAGWAVTILAEERTAQLAALLVPPEPAALPCLRHTFSGSGAALSSKAFVPEGTALTTAAAELATEAREIAKRAGGGLDGIAAIVADTSARFEYASVPAEQRWYHGADAVPQVICGAGNCVDINTYLVAALRATEYRTAYLTAISSMTIRTALPPACTVGSAPRMAV